MIADQPSFYYAFSIWGKRYVKYFGTYALPSLMAPNNIPSLPNKGVSELVVATTRIDAEQIRALPIFPLVEQHIRVRFLELPQTSTDKYNRLTIGHNMAVERAMGRGYAIFLGPDAIHSDGMFTSLYGHAMAGRDAVVGMGPRICLETAQKELVERGIMTPGKPLVLSTRESARMLLDHLHPDYQAVRYGSSIFSQTPYAATWSFPGGMLIRSFSLHPYLINYTRGSKVTHTPLRSGAVDHTFVHDCDIAPHKLHIVTDSDEFVILSVSPIGEREFGSEPNSDCFSSLVRWASDSQRTELQRIYFMHGIKIHSLDLDDEVVALERSTLELAGQVTHTGPTMAEINSVLAEGWSAKSLGVSPWSLLSMLARKIVLRVIGALAGRLR